MDELTRKLNNILVVANDIKQDIAEDWYKLFVVTDKNYTPFGLELNTILGELHDIHDVINEELAEEP